VESLVLILRAFNLSVELVPPAVASETFLGRNIFIALKPRASLKASPVHESLNSFV